MGKIFRRVINLAACWVLAMGGARPAFAQNDSSPIINAVVSAGAFGGYSGVAAPGSFVEIFGTGMAGTSRDWTNADFQGSAAPMSLDGVSVTVGGVAAFVSYISPTQVNAQIPEGVPASATVPVVIRYQSRASNSFNLQLNSREPGLLAPAGFRVAGKQFVAAFHGNSNSLVSGGSIPGVPAAPAIPGETLVLYGIGFGPLRQGSVAGQIASGTSSLAAAFTVSIGGIPAQVQYAGLAPGLVGIYQFNVVVPANTPLGDQPFQYAIDGVVVTKQALFLPVAASSQGTFTLTSTVGSSGGALPDDFSCDGPGSTIPLSWSNAPAGTREFALLMTTLPGDGTTKWNWVVYNIPASTRSLPRDSFLIGTLGVGSDGPGTVYNPPCSQGPGTKTYTYTLYALSDTPAFSVPTSQVTGQMVTDAIAGITLGSARLTLNHTRAANPTGSSAACSAIRNSVRASRSGIATVNCDATYAYVGSNGITTDSMMDGIVSTNLQIPIPQNFNGVNAWKIPLAPAIAAVPTNVVDGPIGVAINGVPIFNPCTQGGCVTGGDTKALGQLDNCNGHAGRADDYHYHAAPNCLMSDQAANYWDTHPLGWALDGFGIFGYRDADGTSAERDAVCGGNTKAVPNAPAGYSYHVTDLSPYVSSCLVGVPSPDLPNQASKYRPLRQPPVTPFRVSGMTLTTNTADGYQELQFSSSVNFVTSETGTDRYTNTPGTYKIRYKQVTGSELATLLATRPNATTCWNFQFVDSGGRVTQPSISYCK